MVIMVPSIAQSILHMHVTLKCNVHYTDTHTHRLNYTFNRRGPARFVPMPVDNKRHTTRWGHGRVVLRGQHTVRSQPLIRGGAMSRKSITLDQQSVHEHEKRLCTRIMSFMFYVYACMHDTYHIYKHFIERISVVEHWLRCHSVGAPSKYNALCFVPCANVVFASYFSLWFFFLSSSFAFLFVRCVLVFMYMLSHFVA